MKKEPVDKDAIRKRLNALPEKEVRSVVDEKYERMESFVERLDFEDQAKIYHEGMLVFAYQLANMMPQNNELQFRALVGSALEVAAERAGFDYPRKDTIDV